MKNRVTIRDVAELCGFSEATVSNALANKALVTQETKAKVFEAARTLGYEVSPIARALKTGRTRTVGVVVSNLANPFYADILLGVSDVLTPLGYQVIVCNTDSKPEEQEFHIAGLTKHMVDGIILLPHSRDSGEALNALNARIPVVTIWRRLSNSEIPFVGLDDEMGMRAAVGHLLELGHRTIAFMRAPEFSSPSADREAVFRRALLERGIAAEHADVVHADISIEGGRFAAHRIMSSTRRPTAVIVSSDLMALGVTAALADLGLRIPEALSLVSFEDTFIASIPQVELTTVSVPRRDMGAAAANLLLQRMSRDGQDVESRILRPSFKVRGSTAPVR
jgi:LacI family transcriptional regulator